jgi:hypothetical protein
MACRAAQCAFHGEPRVLRADHRRLPHLFDLFAALRAARALSLVPCRKAMTSSETEHQRAPTGSQRKKTRILRSPPTTVNGLGGGSDHREHRPRDLFLWIPIGNSTHPRDVLAWWQRVRCAPVPLEQVPFERVPSRAFALIDGADVVPNVVSPDRPRVCVRRHVQMVSSRAGFDWGATPPPFDPPCGTPRRGGGVVYQRRRA